MFAYSPDVQLRQKAFSCPRVATLVHGLILTTPQYHKPNDKGPIYNQTMTKYLVNGRLLCQVAGAHNRKEKFNGPWKLNHSIPPLITFSTTLFK